MEGIIVSLQILQVLEGTVSTLSNFFAVQCPFGLVYLHILRTTMPAPVFPRSPSTAQGGWTVNLYARFRPLLRHV